MIHGRTNINLPQIPYTPNPNAPATIKTYLYNRGEEYTDLTGGWSKGVHTVQDGLGTVTKQTDRIYLKTGSSTSTDDCPIATVNKVDLTKYNKLCASFIGVSGSSSAGRPRMVVAAGPTRGIGSSGNPVVNPNKGFDGTTSVIVEADISNISGEYYVAAGIFTNDSVLSTTAYIDEVWLETTVEQIKNYTMLYDEGDECTDVTGGWSVGNKSNQNDNLTKNADHLYLTTTTGASSKASAVQVDTTNSLSFGDYTKVGMLLTHDSDDYTTSQAGVTRIGIINNKGDYSFKTVILNTKEDIDGLVLWDIPSNNLSGHYSIGSQTNGMSSSYYSRLKVYDVFLTKEDDIATLCNKAGITAPTDLATLIADTNALTTIFANKNAVTYMVKQCTGDFMASVVADSTARGLLQASQNYTLVQANYHWMKFLAMVA